MRKLARAIGSLNPLLLVDTLRPGSGPPSPSRNSPAVSPEEAPSPYVTLLPGRLGVAVHESAEHTRAQEERHPEVYFFTTNLHEAWDVHIGTVCAFAAYVQEQAPPGGRLPVYYSHARARDVANAGLLLGAYVTLWAGVRLEEALDRLRQLPQWPSDAAHALRGLRRAVDARLLDPRQFDRVSHAVLAREPFPNATIVGGRFLVTGSPAAHTRKYVQLLRDARVAAVVRLTDGADYDSLRLSQHGIRVHQVHMERDAVPAACAVREFLNVCLAEDCLAVHCWDGRGNAPTMVALWLMRVLKFSSAEAVAFLRVLRPGAVHPRQLAFLGACDAAVWRGNLLSLPPGNLLSLSPP
jgi:hypothetical protein